MANIALAWLLHQNWVTTVIIGAKTMDQLEDNLNVINIELNTSELRKLDEVSTLPPEYPQWMIDRQSNGRSPGEPTAFRNDNK